MKQQHWFSIKRVYSDVFAIAEFRHFELVISYLILGKENAVLIDTGMGYYDILTAVRTITSLPITVLLTHAHWDHIGGMNLFERVFIYDDIFEISLLEKGFRAQSILELMDVSLFKKPFHPKKYAVAGRTPSELLRDGQVLHIGDIEIHVIHTPGHTPGSVCYYVPSLQILLTGDTIYPGPLYANLSESSIEAYTKSVKKLQKFVGKNVHLLPGHNAVVEDYDLLTQVVNGFDKIVDMHAANRCNEYTSTRFSIRY